MRVLGFGTYDGDRQPRPLVLLEGMRALGADVQELNRPLGFTTEERVAMLHAPRLLIRLAIRLCVRWSQLVLARTRLRHSPDVVLVGYLAQFDVILARLLFPRSVVVLDLLVFADDTAEDRGVGPGLRTRLLGLLDRIAIRCSDVVVVDTQENLALLRDAERRKAVVAPVGAAQSWFADPPNSPPAVPLKVVFFGVFTPLQGAPVIGRALALLPDDSPLEVTMIGRGQDYAETRALVGEDSRVTWIDWLPMSALTSLVAEHDVCLGIFGDSPKSLRVVPTKAFQGAAAGCAIVTSDTRPQRRLLADAAVYVRPGNAGALASALDRLAHNPDEVRSLRKRASELANRSFDPAHCAAPIVSELARRTSTVLT